MKTSIKTLIALALTSLTLTSATYNANAADPNLSTVLTATKKINKIAVSGNVELILVQSADQSIKVYDNYFTNNALVQEKDGELRISSFNKETLTVVVALSNLTSITAGGNATVKTAGKFNILSLDVFLKDQATATLNTNTIDLTADLSGQSNLFLAGTTTNYQAIMGSVAKINMAQFVAEQSNIQSKQLSIASIKKVSTMEDLPTLENS